MSVTVAISLDMTRIERRAAIAEFLVCSFPQRE
jgi:hypothetical protein